jgi:gamma-glutamylcyclotransferase (GGCT)/AIG2-like uncharacterized protein YtfP
VTHAVFAYGTLLFAEVMERVAGERCAATPAVLRGYARRALHGVAYPAVVAQPGAETEGVLYLGVTPAALARLDGFEGDLYDRISRPVKTADGERCAFVYVLRDAHRDRLSARGWDPEAFRARDLAAFVARLR